MLTDVKNFFDENDEFFYRVIIGKVGGRCINFTQDERLTMIQLKLIDGVAVVFVMGADGGGAVAMDCVGRWFLDKRGLFVVMEFAKCALKKS